MATRLRSGHSVLTAALTAAKNGTNPPCANCDDQVAKGEVGKDVLKWLETCEKSFGEQTEYPNLDHQFKSVCEDLRQNIATAARLGFQITLGRVTFKGRTLILGNKLFIGEGMELIGMKAGDRLTMNQYFTSVRAGKKELKDKALAQHLEEEFLKGAANAFKDPEHPEIDVAKSVGSKSMSILTIREIAGVAQNQIRLT